MCQAGQVKSCLVLLDYVQALVRLAQVHLGGGRLYAQYLQPPVSMR